MNVVYRHFDKEGNLLYVGKSINLESRTKQHMKKADWRFLINSIDFMEFSTKIEMDIAELYFINKYNPIHNIKDNRGDSVGIVEVYENWKDFTFKIVPILENLTFKFRNMDMKYLPDNMPYYTIKIPEIKNRTVRCDKLGLYYMINNKREHLDTVIKEKYTIITFDEKELRENMRLNYSSYNKVKISNISKGNIEVLDIKSGVCILKISNDFLNSFVETYEYLYKMEKYYESRII